MSFTHPTALVVVLLQSMPDCRFIGAKKMNTARVGASHTVAFLMVSVVSSAHYTGVYSITLFIACWH